MMNLHFVAELDFLYSNAEERIFKSVDLDYFRKNVTGSMTSGNKFLQKPSDYLALILYLMLTLAVKMFFYYKKT